MRVQQFLAIPSFMLLSNVALAADLDRNDVPDTCWDACGPVVDISHRCDALHDNDDNAERQCVCNWDQASIQIPLCEACIAQHRRDNPSQYDDHDDDDDDDNDPINPHDNDAYDILTSCNLSTTTYNATIQTTAATTTSTSSPISTTMASTSITVNASPTSTGTSPTTGDSGNDTSNNSSSDNDNAASAFSVSMTASFAAAMGFSLVVWL